MKQKRDSSSRATEPKDRSKIGDMERGYIDALLEHLKATDPCEYTIDNLSERAFVQCVNDCAKFYWQMRVEFEAIWADPMEADYDLYETGQDLWHSRNRTPDKGFRRHEGLFTDHDWERLDHFARRMRWVMIGKTFTDDYLRVRDHKKPTAIRPEWVQLGIIEPIVGGWHEHETQTYPRPVR